jgi:hypothetical protein
VNKEGTTDHKERNSTTRSARKLNGAHHGARPLVEIQNLYLLLLFFLIFFLILYHSNKKHTNFQLNWTEDVAYRNFTIFSTKFKASSRLRVSCLRSRIWASSREQTRLGWVWLDANFDSTQFFKKVTQSKFVWKSYDRFTEARLGYDSGRCKYDSELKSGKAKTCCLWWQRLIQWMERLKQGFTINLGLAKRQFTQGG